MALIKVEYLYNGKQDHGLGLNCRAGLVWDLRIRWRFSGLKDHRAGAGGPIGWVFQKVAGSYKVGEAGMWIAEAAYWEMWEVHMAPASGIYVATPSLPRVAGFGCPVNTIPNTVIRANHFNDAFAMGSGNPIYLQMRNANGSVYKKEAWVFYVKNDSGIRNTAVTNWQMGAAQGGAAGGLLHRNTGPACSAVKAMKRVAAVEWDSTAGRLCKWKHLKKPLFSSHRY